MIIKSIELENIRSYKHEIIEFKKGINFFSGDIGSGKSSILLAIEFALFGFKKGDLEAFQIFRKGESNAQVTLILENNKNTYKIIRKLKKSKTNQTITQNNGQIQKNNEDIIDLSPQELNTYIFKLLNLPKEFLTKDKNLLYRFTIYTPQEQLKEILFTDNEKKIEIIRKIFNIDKYKQFQNAVSIYSSKIRENKKVYQSKLENKNKIKEDIKEFKLGIDKNNKFIITYTKKEKEFEEKLQKYKLNKEKLDEKLNKVREILQKYEKELVKINETKKYLEKQEKKLDEINIEVNNTNLKQNKKELVKSKDEKEKLEKELIKINKKKIELQENIKEFEETKKKLEKLEEDNLNIKNKHEKIKDLESRFDIILTQCQIKDLENEIKSNEKLINKETKFKNNKENIEKENIKLKSDIENIEKQLIKIKDKIKNIDSLNTCENCLQKVDSKHKQEIQENYSKESQLLKKEVDITNQKITKNKEEIKNIENKLEKLIKETKNENISTFIIKKEEQLKFLNKKLEDEKKLTKEIKKLKEEVKNQDNKKLKNKIDKIKEKQNYLEKKKEEYERLRDEELKVNKKINDYNIDIEKQQKLIEYIENKIKDIGKISKEIEELRKEIEKTLTIEEKLQKQKDNQILLLDKITKYSQAIEKLYENLKIISNKTAAYKNEIDNLNKNLDKNTNDIEKLEKIEKKLEKLLEYENLLLNKFIDMTSNMEKQVLTKYFVEFNEEFETIFKELIEDNEIDVRLSTDFVPVIEQNGFDVEVKNLSGGEKASLAIAYRLGLKKVIEDNLEQEQKLSLLILDEPTDGLSSEQVSRFGNLLKNSSINQIIAVSHDEKLEAIADNVLKIEKTNHESKVYSY